MPVLSFELNTLNVFPCMICYLLNPSANVFSLPVLEPKWRIWDSKFNSLQRLYAAGLLCGGMSRLSPCRGSAAAPGHPRLTAPLQLLSSFSSFPTAVYSFPGSLFITWEGSGGPLCTRALSLCLPVESPDCHDTSMFALLHGGGHRLRHVRGGSPSFAVCPVYSSHSARLCFSIKRVH